MVDAVEQAADPLTLAQSVALVQVNQLQQLISDLSFIEDEFDNEEHNREKVVKEEIEGIEQEFKVSNPKEEVYYGEYKDGKDQGEELGEEELVQSSNITNGKLAA